MNDSELREIMKLEFRRRKFFLDMGDTYGCMVWEKYDKKVRNYGFKLGYSNEFRGNYEDPEMELIYYLEEKGLILYVCTEGGFIVQTAHLFGEIGDVKQGIDLSSQIGLEECVHIYHPESSTIEFDQDVDHGLAFKTNIFVSNYHLNKKWISHQSFSFANYMDVAKYSSDILPEVSKRKAQNCKKVYDIIYGGRT